MVAAQICIDHRGVVAEAAGERLGDHLALCHHHHPVADVADDVHVVFDEHHGHTLVAQRLDVFEQALGQRRVHPGHRFVEHDDLGIGHQRACHLQQLALATRQRTGVVVGLGVELEPLEQFVCALGGFGLLLAPRPRRQRLQHVLAALVASTEPHVVEYRQLRQRLGELEGTHHAVAGNPVRHNPSHVLAVERPATCVGLVEPGDQVEERGLARPVGADQSRDASALDLQMLHIDGFEATECPGDVVHRDDRVGFGRTRFGGDTGEELGTLSRAERLQLGKSGRGRLGHQRRGIHPDAGFGGRSGAVGTGGLCVTSVRHLAGPLACYRGFLAV